MLDENVFKYGAARGETFRFVVTGEPIMWKAPLTGTITDAKTGNTKIQQVWNKKRNAFVTKAIPMRAGLDSRVVNWKNTVSRAVQKQAQSRRDELLYLIGVPLEIGITLRITKPKSVTNILPIGHSVGDITNYVKTTEDGAFAALLKLCLQETSNGLVSGLDAAVQKLLKLKPHRKVDINDSQVVNMRAFLRWAYMLYEPEKDAEDCPPGADISVNAIFITDEFSKAVLKQYNEDINRLNLEYRKSRKLKRSVLVNKDMSDFLFTKVHGK